ncbi:MAG: hypothetical protein RIS47_1211 [Bacteroidota bacterium]
MKQTPIHLFLLTLLTFLTACAPTATVVKPGIEQLEASNFALLKGKRIGLITNPTGIDSHFRSTVDILANSADLTLTTLFGPEHGVRGDFSAGDAVQNNTDAKTGIRCYSLYGKTKKPTPEMLAEIDVLVYDIQDIGARSYTFISTLGLAMEAAAENNVEFVVLDRPNPLGGNRVEGSIVTDGFFSFVSQYAIPYIYGLTVGELARYLNEEGCLANKTKCKLTVIPLQNWTRNMSFTDTKLPWVPSSPHIPRANSAYFYSATGILGEFDANMVGIGYTLPFEVLALPHINADSVATEMNKLGLDGIHFRPIQFKPYYGANKGQAYSGVQLHITDFKTVRLTSIQFYFAQVIYQMYHLSIFEQNTNRYDMFDKVCGSNSIREKFCTAYKYTDIQAMWEASSTNFKNVSRKYYLYK